MELYLGYKRVTEIVEYLTTTARSPTPGVRLVIFRTNVDKQKQITRVDNSLFEVRKERR